jgi:hypothetical protein
LKSRWFGIYQSFKKLGTAGSTEYLRPGDTLVVCHAKSIIAEGGLINGDSCDSLGGPVTMNGNDVIIL